MESKVEARATKNSSAAFRLAAVGGNARARARELLPALSFSRDARPFPRYI